jgi:hypothetical protein
MLNIATAASSNLCFIVKYPQWAPTSDGNGMVQSPLAIAGSGR